MELMEEAEGLDINDENGEFTHRKLECVYWNLGHPDNENQSEGRTETIDSNIFKSS